MDKWIALVKANMKARQVTQNQLATRLGMSQGGVAHWLGKRRVPSLDDMNRVLEELGLGYLEAALVIREKGEAPADEAAPAVQYNPYFRYPVRDWKQPGRVHESRPAYGPARFEASDYDADGEAFWLQVSGDAMTAPSGPSIAEGMMILVDPALAAEPGKLVVAQWAGSSQATFRKLIEESGQRYLMPLNPTYPKALLTDDCQIIGVVVQATVKF
ncbi:Cro/Cl family transcriptional regulator [Pseudomonas sp. WS 5059]|jgi:SOS-response transcriptional repressor LexA|uniref:LexA family protein n=1 Tax=unclassified Pseudomonas TaxID=196821 RepID=UPI0014729C96|nr:MULTISPECIES: XRE family transcriptional regulator [unclassified Pseudomonas]NMX64519.1 Cro/Cl family transcriptional regulator [Pseudomonas sp. WS 5079]NMX68414.1 Cro/Cl family transcriptional regulator [Pseudomonas sp. WS 5111]NMX84746.1 Cro/Cl family transcriptional regulator [Pseudomonas sp. WS 5010]NMY05470.1 Cro/Cl family transcriptional regulator [Pseudomonas sp. WS 5059]NMY27779.1 Cro/Cl family transcriptional regulator [Pseudomonas sp. WS 5021]